MVELIVKLLPEWVLPVVGALLVWFGLNYLFIAPELGRRTIDNSCPAASRSFCHCVGDYLIADARLQLAFWTSSFGYYSVAKSREVLAARAEGERQCKRS